MTNAPNDARMCARCVLDTTAADIEFDEDGICNYCSEFETLLLGTNLRPSSETLDQLAVRVRESAKGSDYDCIVGLSGGADSSWALYQACKLGLKPLAVHMDNGWNSELAQSNIENLVRKLGVDLFTYVIDWDEFRSLQQAFFDADVIDMELLTDNALAGVNYRQAGRVGAKYILSGSNTSTEGLRMPSNWSCGNKLDKRNIRGIWRAHGLGRFPRTFPLYGIRDYLADRALRHITWTPFLDYFDYNKAEAMAVLERELGYRPYPYKHYESVFTRFYQGYLLPKKFGVDKRKNHLSALIMTGQMTRKNAVAMLEEPTYPALDLLEEDTKFFLSKMNWSLLDLERYILRPEVPHETYGTDKPLWGLLQSFVSWRKARRSGRSAETTG